MVVFWRSPELRSLLLFTSRLAVGRMRLTGKVVLITGGTAGIGRATAELCEREGASAVVYTGRSKKDGNIETRVSSFVLCDHSVLSDCERVVNDTIEKFGKIDVLFNNAGLVESGNAESTSVAVFEEVMRINVTAPFYMARLVIPHMRKNKGGVIINNASDWGLVGAPNALAYCASKGALIQLTRCLALDHAGDGIRVNAVCPGDTFVERWTTDGYYRGSGAVPAAEALAPRPDLPLGRVARAEEIAKAVLFLMCDDSSYMTGQTLTVDGGNTAR